jgi:hypothetical protein
MTDLALTQVELMHRMNTSIETLTGRYGTICERTIYEMLSGRTRWPHAKTRAALIDVLGRSPGELGFRPPSKEAPVRRRAFITSTTGAAIATMAPNIAAPNSVGTADVLRLRSRLDALTGLDQTRGGHSELQAKECWGSWPRRVRGKVVVVAPVHAAVGLMRL